MSWVIIIGVIATIIAIFDFLTGKNLQNIIRWLFRKKPLPIIPELEKEELKKEIAREIFKDFKPYLDGLPTSSGKIKILFKKGLRFYQKNEWDKAISVFTNATKLAKGSQLVALFNIIGACHTKSKRLDPALENYKTSYQLAKQYNDIEGESEALDQIGTVHYFKGELGKALKFYKDALIVSKATGRKEGLSGILRSFGLLYQEKGELKKALKYYQKALNVDRETNNKEGLLFTLTGIASMYLFWKKWRKALKFHTEALKVSEALKVNEALNPRNLIEFITLNLISVGFIYGVKGDKSKALQYLKKALKTAKGISAQETIHLIQVIIKKFEKKEE